MYCKVLADVIIKAEKSRSRTADGIAPIKIQRLN